MTNTLDNCTHSPTGFCVRLDWDSCPCYGCTYFTQSKEYKEEQEAYARELVERQRTTRARGKV